MQKQNLLHEFQLLLQDGSIKEPQDVCKHLSSLEMSLICEEMVVFFEEKTNLVNELIDLIDAGLITTFSDVQRHFVPNEISLILREIVSLGVADETF